LGDWGSFHLTLSAEGCENEADVNTTKVLFCLQLLFLILYIPLEPPDVNIEAEMPDG